MSRSDAARSAAAAAILMLLGACYAPTTPWGGALAGTPDTHCNGPGPDGGLEVQMVNPAACIAPPDAGPAGDAGIDAGTMGDAGAEGLSDGGDAGSSVNDGGGLDAGPGADAGPPPPEYLAPHYGVVAYDDACKYKVAFEVSPIRENQNAVFNVQVTSLADGAPVTGAYVTAWVFMGWTHPGPPNSQTTDEPYPGRYEIGPIQFDASGLWTVEFQIFGPCTDSVPDSPRGHVGFYLSVP